MKGLIEAIEELLPGESELPLSRVEQEILFEQIRAILFVTKNASLM